MPSLRVFESPVCISCPICLTWAAPSALSESPLPHLTHLPRFAPCLPHPRCISGPLRPGDSHAEKPKSPAPSLPVCLTPLTFPLTHSPSFFQCKRARGTNGGLPTRTSYHTLHVPCPQPRPNRRSKPHDEKLGHLARSSATGGRPLPNPSSACTWGLHVGVAL